MWARRACAVTGEHSLPVLEAAHIRPYARGGEHDVANGLSLRTDIHRLFDKGYVTVDEDAKFVVGRRLKQASRTGARTTASRAAPSSSRRRRRAIRRARRWRGTGRASSLGEGL
jgi:hypothetical protein